MDPISRKNQELSAILQVSRVLTRSFDLEKNLNEVMKILASHLDMQRGCVFLLDNPTREIRIVAAYGLTKEEIDRGSYRIGEGIVGRVIESAAPMFIPNIGAEPKFLNKTDSRPRKSGISFLCIPISLDQETLGVISVDRIYKEAHGNVDDDLRVLHIVASSIGQFVKLWNHFRRTEKECGDLRSQLKEKYSLPNIIGESPEFQHVLKSVHKVAATDTTVLLLGESGTGKELIAQTLHYQSRRAGKKFVAVNLAALPETLVEGELFGVEKGAYTGATGRRIGRFEMAAGGTLFLDEIGELPLPIQVKLLRVLQERTFERIGSSTPLNTDVRVVAATNRNLLEEVNLGRFREDLYWRLNVVPLVLPPLRERKPDIPILINHYIKQFNSNYLRDVYFTNETRAALVEYDWPGNVRELANVVERLIIMADKNEIQADDLSMRIRNGGNGSKGLPDVFPNDSYSLSDDIEIMERQRIIKALRENAFVQQRASRALGITPRQLGYRIKKYNIDIRKI